MYLFYKNSKMKYEIKLIFQISFSLNVKCALTQVSIHEQIITFQVALLLKQIIIVPVVKNPPVNGDIRDAGSIPGLGKSPRRGHVNPLQ